MKAPSPSEVASHLRREAARLNVLAQRLDPVDEPPSAALTPGSALVAKERARQVTVEGHDTTTDAAWTGNELAWAAYCYLERAAQDRLPQADPSVPHVWPLTRSRWRPKDSRLRNLTIAAALVTAEIDRLWEAGERT